MKMNFFFNKRKSLTGKSCFLLAALVLVPSLSGAEEANRGFDEHYELEEITFHVTCANRGSLNQLDIAPGGLETDNSVIKQEIDGSVTGAEAADLNKDGSPEIYVYVNSAGSGSYGSLIAYSANNKKSLSAIYLPPLEEDAENSRGYMGHDQFSVVENSLSRRFPVYKSGDTNAEPSGGTRQLQYKLIAGEAGWQLQLTDSILLK
jgi:hypothetical protein